MLYSELLSPIQLQKLIGGNAMKPFITVGSRSTCKKCGNNSFTRVLDEEDEILIPICDSKKCKNGRPKKYRVAFSLPQIGTNRFKKYLKSKNEIGEPLDTLTKAKNFKSYIENKIKKEGVNFDPRELGSEEERKMFYVNNLIPHFIKEQKARLKRSEITPGGWRKIERVTRLYIGPVFGEFHLKQVTRPAIKRELKRAGVSPSVGTEITKILGPFLGFAVDMGLIPVRPQMPSFEKSKTFKAADFYNSHEQNLVISNIKNRKHQIAISILAMYSARKSEIEPLTWGDIDFKRETVRFNKHVSEGEIIPGLKSSPEKCLIYPFFPGLKDYFLELIPSLDSSELVFPGRNGNLIGKNALWKSWTDSVDELIKSKKLNKKVDLHRGTRSTTLSVLYEKGYSLEELAELYGGDVNTMKRHYAKKEVQRVAHLWEGQQ